MHPVVYSSPGPVVSFLISSCHTVLYQNEMLDDKSFFHWWSQFNFWLSLLVDNIF